MSRFQVLPVRELAEKHFEEWPVWSEHYDVEELEDVERWGLDRDEVLRQFRENQREGEHCVYTLFGGSPFPERMRIFIKASFMSANGRALNGYVMNEDAYCIAIFHDGQEFLFSSNAVLSDLNREEQLKLADALGSHGSDLFPVKYQTEYFAADGSAIAGVFSLC